MIWDLTVTAGPITQLQDSQYSVVLSTFPMTIIDKSPTRCLPFDEIGVRHPGIVAIGCSCIDLGRSTTSFPRSILGLCGHQQLPVRATDAALVCADGATVVVHHDQGTRSGIIHHARMPSPIPSKDKQLDVGKDYRNENLFLEPHPNTLFLKLHPNTRQFPIITKVIEQVPLVFRNRALGPSTATPTANSLLPHGFWKCHPFQE